MIIYDEKNTKIQTHRPIMSLRTVQLRVTAHGLCLVLFTHRTNLTDSMTIFRILFCSSVFFVLILSL